MRRCYRVALWLAFLMAACPVILNAQRRMEHLDRGVVAVDMGNSVFVGWRMFGNEYGHTTYNLYRDGVKLNAEPLAGATSYIDEGGSPGASYSVAAVIDSVEQPQSGPVGVWGNAYRQIPLQRPAGGTTPDDVSYSYLANDLSVGDLDGDGQYELVLKWEPSNAKDNSQSGYTGNVLLDGYEPDGTLLWRIDLGINIRAGAHYTQFMVYDLDGDGMAEVYCKTAPGTRDGSGGYLSLGPAASADHEADYRNPYGYILSGPEYFTVFNGLTGNELATVDYIPQRGSVSAWGDNYGNRVDRFLACVAYLDGQHPSVVMARGYYTRAVLAAWDWDGSQLSSRWVFDSNTPGNGAYAGQGNHNLSVADVDGDEKDEIVYGSCTIDDDGTGLYSTGLGHGDALHVTDHDPDRPGLEVFMPHESGGNGVTFRDAATGEIIWQKRDDSDVGRGLAADIIPGHKGSEAWASSGLGVYDCKGEKLTGKYIPSINFAIWWDGDEVRELLDSNHIDKYNEGTLLSALNCTSNNGTKSTPCISADLVGDWREEVIFRTVDNHYLRMYTTTYPTDREMYTLMHDPQYRLSIAWQNVAYNQPPHTGFYLGAQMLPPPLPPVFDPGLRWNSGPSWDITGTQSWLRDGTPSYYNDGDGVLFDLSGSAESPISLEGTISPSEVVVFAPQDYTFTGPGSLSGDMKLTKGGSGTLVLGNDNGYTGSTGVWEGDLAVNGTLSYSSVEVHGRATAGGTGILGGGVVVRASGGIVPGGDGVTDTLFIRDHLVLEKDATLYFELSGDTSGTVKTNDLIIVDGDITLGSTGILDLEMTDDSLQAGHYKLIEYTGDFNGDLSGMTVKGIRGIPWKLVHSEKSILLFVEDVRDPAVITWEGTENNTWDLVFSMNWLKDGTQDMFVAGDTVVFDELGSAVPDILLSGSLPIGHMVVDAVTDYSFGGEGYISGEGGIHKLGSGRLILQGMHDFTGPVIIDGGSVEVSGITRAGQPGSLGAATADPGNLQINGSTLLVSGKESYSDRGVMLGEPDATILTAYATTNILLSGGITGTGTLIKEGAGTLTLLGEKQYTGGTVIEHGTLKLGDDPANVGGPGSGPVTLRNGILSMYNNSGTYTYGCDWDLEVPSGCTGRLEMDSRCSLTGSLTGGGTLDLYTPFVRSELDGDWSGFTGTINVSTDGDGGWFLVSNQNGFRNAAVRLSDGVRIIYTHSEDAVVEIGELEGTAGSVLGAGGESGNHITWVIGGRNTNAVFDGMITDDQFKNSGASASIIKEGTGNWTLTGASSYSGSTVINGGTLTIRNSEGSATGSGPVAVNGGTTLNGYGSIDGPLTVSGDAALSIGHAAANDTFTVRNDVSFSKQSYLSLGIDPDTKSCDRLTVTGKLRLDGILYINEAGDGDFIPGDAFYILDAGDCSGAFDMILPEVPGEGLAWDTTYLRTNGVIQVVNAPNGMESPAGGYDIGLFPNPAGDVLFLTITGTGTAGDHFLEVKCYDSYGRAVWQDRIPVTEKGYETAVDLHGMPAGIYVLVISGNGEHIMERFIKH
jgi:autotransporter-associated beta strand protein